MTLPLYFAPIHRLSNWVYRHFLLEQGADFVFSELIMVNRWDGELAKEKFKCFPEDLSRTIFQIGANTVEEISFAVKEFKKIHPNVQELNLNMGCPQSSMQQRQVCGGLLLNKYLMFTLSKFLAQECKNNSVLPSVKLRLGTGFELEQIIINEYLVLLERAGIKKVYIHARPLKYNYARPAMWNEFESLSKEFPSLDLIFNGDVDSYEAYSELEKFSPSGIMIGRTALSNPLIFQQIKDKEKSLSGKVGTFDPELKDNSLVQNEQGLVQMSEKKKLLIDDFLSLAKKENLREEILANHVAYLNKGVSKGFFKK